MGEVTTNLNDKDSHCLQFSDIAMQDQNFSIHGRSHQYPVLGKVSRIFMHKLVHDSAYPVLHLQNYFSCRGNDEGDLFRHPIGTPICRSQFTAILNRVFVLHRSIPIIMQKAQFRIGACTWHMEQGCPDSQLCNMDRCLSNALLKYAHP